MKRITLMMASVLALQGAVSAQQVNFEGAQWIWNVPGSGMSLQSLPASVTFFRAELTLPDRGLARFVDMENDEKVTLHTGAVRDAWKREMRDHMRALRRLAAARQVDYALARTDRSYFELFDRLA